MFGVNNPNAMRMLKSLYDAHAPAPAPAHSGAYAGGSAPKAKAPSRRRAPSPSVSSSTDDSESDYESDSSSSYESYDDVEVIYKKVVDEAACPYVSPAGLRDQKTKKDAIKHLKAKNCPEVPKLKKPSAKAALPPSPKAPGPRKAKGGAQAAAKADTKQEAALPATVSEPIVLAKPEDAAIPKKSRAKKTVVIAEAPAPAPAPAPAASGKTKRAPNAYAKFVGEQRKAGKSMAEAAAAWKAQKGS